MSITWPQFLREQNVNSLEEFARLDRRTQISLRDGHLIKTDPQYRALSEVLKINPHNGYWMCPHCIRSGEYLIQKETLQMMKAHFTSTHREVFQNGTIQLQKKEGMWQ